MSNKKAARMRCPSPPRYCVEKNYTAEELVNLNLLIYYLYEGVNRPREMFIKVHSIFWEAIQAKAVHPSFLDEEGAAVNLHYVDRYKYPLAEFLLAFGYFTIDENQLVIFKGWYNNNNQDRWIINIR